MASLPEPIKDKCMSGTYYRCSSSPLCKFYSYTRAIAKNHITKCKFVPRKRSSSDMDDVEQQSKEKIPRIEPESNFVENQKEPESKQFRCKYCQIMFTTKKERNSHHRKVHPSGEVVTTSDEIRLSVTSSVMSSVTSSSSTALALVDDEKPTSAVALINDEEDDVLPDLVPEPLIEWKCSACDFKSTSRQNIIEHKEKIHRQSYTKFCEKCPFTTSNETSYVNHCRMIHREGKKVPECPVPGCDFRAILKIKMKKHVQLVHRHYGYAPVSSTDCSSGSEELSQEEQSEDESSGFFRSEFLDEIGAGSADDSDCETLATKRRRLISRDGPGQREKNENTKAKLNSHQCHQGQINPIPIENCPVCKYRIGHRLFQVDVNINRVPIRRSKVSLRSLKTYNPKICPETKILTLKNTVATKPCKIQVPLYSSDQLKNLRLICQKPAGLLKNSLVKRNRPVGIKWFDGSDHEAENKNAIMRFGTSGKMHTTVSSIYYFKQDWQLAIDNAENNQDIRGMKKEARYQMSIEKGLGFYRPKFIKKWINENLPDFICHLCRREFGIDETDDDNFRNRSDMYCTPCFQSVKQMYFACAPARSYKLKEDASYKRRILQRESPHNLFRPLGKSNSSDDRCPRLIIPSDTVYVI